MGAKPGMGNKSGMGSKPGMGGSKPGMGSKPGLGGPSSKPGMGMGSSSKPGLGGSKPGGFGSSSSKPTTGGFGAKPGIGSAKPGIGSAKPGTMGAKPGTMGAKPGAVGAKPAAGGFGAKPGVATAKPGTAPAKPGLAGSKPGLAGSKPGTTSASAVKPGVKPGTGSPKGVGVKPTGVQAKPADKTVAGVGSRQQSTGGLSNQQNRNALNGGFDRDSRSLQRGNSAGGGSTNQDGSGLSRNIPLSQMDRMDITKMTPRELMLLERQYGAGWLKQLAPTQHMRLQNTLGGTNITSATPVGLSSHMDPKALAVAAGIGATTFVPLGNNDDGNEERQSSYDTEGQRERSMSDGQEYYGEQEQPEQEERFVSDLMEATTIGENHHKLQFTTSEPAFNHASGQYTPLLDKDPQELASQQPRVQYQKQPEIKFPLTKQDASMACQMNLGDINNYSLQRGTSDGTFCYSIFLIIGVLLMGVGIVLYILQALLGYKAVESIVGGIMFVTGVIVLICSMVGWKRRASQNEKKMIQV